MLSHVVFAQSTIYKWRDADGKLHFSQSPPKHATAETGAMAVESSVKLRRRDGRLYCGTQALPVSSAGLVDYLVSVQRLADISQRTARDACVARWAARELDNYAAQLRQIRSRYESLVSRYQQLSTHKQNACPKGQGLMVGETARRWADCHAPVDREIREIRSEIQKLSVFVKR